MKNEFVLAFNEVLEEKGLPKEVILKALESAMVSAYRRSVNASNAQLVEAKIDPETGKVVIFAEKEVVDSVQDERTEVNLPEAQRYNPEAELGSMVVVESTPRDFGRVAAQTARQVIQQRIRDAERQLQMDHYQKQIGEIISGVVQATNAQGYTVGMEMRAEGTMLRKDVIPREKFRIHDRVRALISEVKDSPRGPQIFLSRTHRDFLRRLLENEVPEIFHGVVEIRSIAREPGDRAKVAVSATQSGIDPVGACVGVRGVRIQAIVRELHDEKIDVIEWSEDPAVFIAKAISPARVNGVYLDLGSESGRTATVVVPEDQLSLAIGRDGQNARLAAKLTGWRIDIKSLSEAAADILYRLQNDAKLARTAEKEKETVGKVEDLLARKAEGRPLAQEEYDQIAKFIDRVEKATRVAAEPVPQKLSADDELRKAIPASAFETNILDSQLPEHISVILQESGMATLGDLAMQVKKDPDFVLKLQGIAPKSMEKINEVVQTLLAPPAEKPEEAELVAAAAVAEEPVEQQLEAVDESAVEEAPVAEGEMVEEMEPEIGRTFEPVEEGEEVSFIDVINEKPGEKTIEFFTEEEEEEDSDLKTDKKKKKKKSVAVEYDPERDLVVRRKKHKRGGGAWDDEWTF